MAALNIAGEKYGKLTAIKRVADVYSGGKYRTAWECQCDCGNTCIALTDSLRNGRKKSCGCLAKDQERIKNTIYKTKNKKNRYEFVGDYVIGYDCNDVPFYFDKEDYEAVSKYRWLVYKTGYVRSIINGKNTSMHRFLFRDLLSLEENHEKVIDHINHNTTDNRKCNLRIATLEENSRNNRNHKHDVDDEYVQGVSYREDYDLWYATININGKQKYLGGSKNKDDVVAKRKDAEEQIYNEFSYNQSMKQAEAILIKGE